ncbi:SDR family NAD(P)-dependent oxidoreductase [Actinomadura citrea]|jgi:3-oxoacyl-[acyl-carrier protein] reductase|uniref:3-oxoacyl-[acyl-carrier protein] reductase n=1 Tax=Actinomadura citrea TaxID=46158 RepID=A0A7Y9GDH6_9ACTN|nr:SDR family oxidoreductase [Actinomadura citrea]NYE14532.1 3-oxoacyl-[acyl-carrier protein] reductase [Actinomadura citrea]GGU06214.1 3-oxoacyl-ACP reductase [Actinomadura citrea]
MARTIVVTGGGTGIGRAVAARFATGGDRVVVIGRRAEVLEKAAGEIGGTALPADLGDPAEVERVRAELAERFGSVDVLVNNAGGNADNHGGSAGVAERWTSNFRINVLTSVLPTEAFRDLLNPSGTVVFISSIAALRGSGGTSYGPMKAALHPYACDLAAALGPRGVTVNVVAPGFIEDTEFFGDVMSDERRAAQIAQTHTGRAGTPGDVAETVHWLASPGAGHVTAQIIQVNGGAERGR